MRDSDNLRRCEVCKSNFAAGSNRAKYCPACAEKIHRRQKAESERKRRLRLKFLRGHESEIILFEAAAKALKQMGVAKLPDMEKLKTEYAAMTDKKSRLYDEYKRAKKQLSEYGIVKRNIDSVIYPAQSKAKEQER